MNFKRKSYTKWNVLITMSLCLSPSLFHTILFAKCVSSVCHSHNLIWINEACILALPLLHKPRKFGYTSFCEANYLNTKQSQQTPTFSWTWFKSCRFVCILNATYSHKYAQTQAQAHTLKSSLPSSPYFFLILPHLSQHFRFVGIAMSKNWILSNRAIARSQHQHQ